MTEDQDIRRDFYVYAYYRDGGPVYIGKGQGDRWLRHTKRPVNPHLRNMLRRDRADCTARMSWAKVAEGLTSSEAFALEVRLIREIGREPNGPLVNRTVGGEGGSDGKALLGKKRKPETLAKLLEKGALRRGVPLTAEHRAKIAAGNKGKTNSPEARAKMSAAAIGNTNNLGRRHSPETLAQLRAAAVGRVPPDTPETREKKRRAMLGRKFPDRAPGSPHSPETREKMRASALALGPKSAEVREKLRAALKGRKRSPDAVAKMVATNAAKRAALAAPQTT